MKRLSLVAVGVLVACSSVSFAGTGSSSVKNVSNVTTHMLKGSLAAGDGVYTCVKPGKYHAFDSRDERNALVKSNFKQELSFYDLNTKSMQRITLSRVGVDKPDFECSKVL